MSDIYITLHISTTCDHNEGFIPRDANEIIELSFSLIDATSLKSLQSDTIYIKPINTPITPYCTSVTGITWDQVKDGTTFKDALATFDKVVQDEVLAANKEFSLVSMELNKLRVQLPREARDKSVVLPSYLQHPRIFDLQSEYCKWQTTHPESLSYTSNSLANILTALEVDRFGKDKEREEGDGETKRDDKDDKAAKDDKEENPAKDEGTSTPQEPNTSITNVSPNSSDSEIKSPPSTSSSMIDIYSELLIQLIKKSMPVEDHPTVLTKPYDSSQDVKLFLTERSKILYLSNLPFDTTQAELESWFTQYGARPIAFWTLKSVDNQNTNNTNNNGTIKKVKGITGFAVFGTHEEATEALSMNGRGLNNRPVEIQPSSTQVLDKASDLLTPFPPSKNRPRPGDWTCPSCGFSNFQRRTACFRCSFPSSSAVTFQDQMHPARRTNYSESDKTIYNQYYPEHGNQHMNRNNYNNNNSNNVVPFRAGDWKCSNETCQYHNFAKNLVCLKCGMNKPINLQNNGHGNGQNNGMKMNQVHSVSSTAAAIAAATASGQPLNLSNNYMQKKTYKQPYSTNLNRSTSNTTPVQQGLQQNLQQGSLSSNLQQGSLSSNLQQGSLQSNLQQGNLQSNLQHNSQGNIQNSQPVQQFQQYYLQPDSQSPQLAPTQPSTISQTVPQTTMSQGTMSQASSMSPVGDASYNQSSPGLYSFNYPYRNGSDVNFNTISNQFNSLNLNKN